jgi:hypothetical protein
MRQRASHLSARCGHQLAFDPALGGVVLFGGTGDEGLLADTWLWDGARWSELEIAGPLARTGHGMVFDRARNAILLSGGVRASEHLGSVAQEEILDDTWILEAGAWRELPVGGRVHRAIGTVLAFDPLRGETMRFGGLYDRTGLPGGTWAIRNDEWIELDASEAAPEPRTDHAFAIDRITGTALLYGGERDGIGLRDLWSWDRTGWRRIEVAGAVPPPAKHLSLSRDELRSIWVLLLERQTDLATETWIFDGTAWSFVGSPAPQGGTLAYDPQTRRVLCFGGHDSDQPNFHAFDGASWIPLPSEGPRPSTRFHPGMTYDPGGERMILHGGELGEVDTWAWDGSRWSPLASGEGPEPEASLAYDRARGAIVALDSRGLWELGDRRWHFTGTYAFAAPPAIYDQASRALLTFSSEMASLDLRAEQRFAGVMEVAFWSAEIDPDRVERIRVRARASARSHAEGMPRGAIERAFEVVLLDVRRSSWIPIASAEGELDRTLETAGGAARFVDPNGVMYVGLRPSGDLADLTLDPVLQVDDIEVTIAYRAD